MCHIGRIDTEPLCSKLMMARAKDFRGTKIKDASPLKSLGYSNSSSPPPIQLIWVFHMYCHIFISEWVSAQCSGIYQYSRTWIPILWGNGFKTLKSYVYMCPLGVVAQTYKPWNSENCIRKTSSQRQNWRFGLHNESRLTFILRQCINK